MKSLSLVLMTLLLSGACAHLGGKKACCTKSESCSKTQKEACNKNSDSCSKEQMKACCKSEEQKAKCTDGSCEKKKG